MSSASASASNNSSFPNAPPSSPIQSMDKNGESKSSGGASKISYAAAAKSAPAKYFWKDGTWRMAEPYVNVKDSLIIKIENKKNEKEFHNEGCRTRTFTGQTATVYQSPYATVAG